MSSVLLKYEECLALRKKVELTLEWRLEDRWYLYSNNILVAKVDNLFFPLRGIDGWYFWLRGKRKPWLKRDDNGWSTAEGAKNYCQDKVVDRLINDDQLLSKLYVQD